VTVRGRFELEMLEHERWKPPIDTVVPAEAAAPRPAEHG